jgi:membrane-associated phospholipid phosphatase
LDKKRQKRYGFLAAFLMLAVSVSRLYLGAHSLDQVMQGLFMGTSISILYTQGGLKQFITKLLLSK